MKLEKAVKHGTLLLSWKIKRIIKMSTEVKIHKMSRKLKVYLILFALLIVSAGLFKLYRISLKNRLNSIIESMHAAGYLLTMEELNRKFSIPSGSENAADLVLEAIYQYYTEPIDDVIQKFLTTSNTDIRLGSKDDLQENVTRLRRFLIDNENALEMLHKASGLQYCSYPENFYETEGFLKLTKSIKLLNLQAVYFSETGDSDSSLKALISSFNIVSLFAKEPRFTYHLTRMFYYGQMIFTLKFCLNKANFTEEQLMKLEKAVADALDFSDLHGFYEEEMCRIFDIFGKDENITEDIISQDVHLAAAQFYIFFYKHLGIVDSDRIFYLDYMRRYIEASKLALIERYNAFNKIEADLKKRSRLYILAAMLAGLNRNIDNEKQVITSLQTAKSAIAIKRYCLSQGSFPETLNDLVPHFLGEVPVDSNGKELKFKKIDAGCIIYSEGPVKININSTPLQSDLNNYGIKNLGVWFIIEKQ